MTGTNASGCRALARRAFHRSVWDMGVVVLGGFTGVVVEVVIRTILCGVGYGCVCVLVDEKEGK